MAESPQNQQGSDHFKGRDAIGHIAQVQARGKIMSAEIHGTEAPGKIIAATDAARDTAIALTFLGTLLTFLKIPAETIVYCLILFGGGWTLWKAGRSAWLGWFQLERLHRVIAQEKWEIENNRQQEKSELKELYAAKGFEGKLLDDVVDVLMADSDRLLRVMIEEELGLSLESHEHPVEQAIGAAVGALFALASCVIFTLLFSIHTLPLAAAFVLIVTASYSAKVEKNDAISASVWNVAIGGLAWAVVYFMAVYLTHSG